MPDRPLPAGLSNDPQRELALLNDNPGFRAALGHVETARLSWLDAAEKRLSNGSDANIQLAISYGIKLAESTIKNAIKEADERLKETQ